MSMAGMSRARLGRMHDVMAGYVERGKVPGLVTLVSRGGEVHVDALGTMAYGDSAPMRRDSIFRISSMTKPVIAAAALILVEECKLRLDNPVERWLPELADRNVLRRLDGPIDDTVPANRPITVRDVLTFRMGFGQMMASPDDYPILREAISLQLGMGAPNPSEMPEPDEWMRRLGQLPLMHQPGERWMYNTGSDVLSVLIARASGQPLETFLRERLFAPLGMKDTGFSVPASQVNRLVTSYVNDPESGEPVVYDRSDGGQWTRTPAFPSGAGGLVSTVDDYLAFARMLLSQGKHDGMRILSRFSVQTMATDQLTPEQKAISGLVPGQFDSSGWGFGLSIVTRRDDIASAPGRYGWDGGLGTSWFSDPGEDMVCVLMTQRGWESPAPPDVNLDFWNLAYLTIQDD